MKLIYILDLLFFFLVELLTSGLRVAFELVYPRRRYQPGFVAVPVDIEGRFALMLLTSLITLTPDSMVIDVSPDGKVVYVYDLFVEHPDLVREKIRNGFEARVRRLLA